MTTLFRAAVRLGLLAGHAAALAADWGGGLGLASAQTQRGLSPSLGEPAVFADVYWRFAPGWQASLGAARWATRPGRASGEFTLGLSRAWFLDDDWTLATTLSHAGRLGGRPTRRVDYDELSASVSWQGRGQLLLALSPNTTAALEGGGVARGQTRTLEFTWHERLVGRWSVDAGIGHYDLGDFGRPGYSYASAGLSWGAGPWLASLAYVTNRGVAATTLPELRRSRWLVSLWWSY
jgi:hypothetical protein